MHVTDKPLRMPSGKSIVFFMGAGFCPFCAAERWAIVNALSKFGTWEGLTEDRSSDHDEKYLNIPTQSFARARYASAHIEFIGRETADRNFEPLHELDDRDYEILDSFNPDQIIPFLLIDGQFAQVGSGYSPQLLEDMDHERVRLAIANPSSQVGAAINAETNNIIALICKSIGDRAEICGSRHIKTLVQESSLQQR